MRKNSKILILGAKGLLGSAINRELFRKNFHNLLTPTREEVNLLNKLEVEEYIKKSKPEFVFMVAGLVGGIRINNERPADFVYENSTMILNVLEAIKNNAKNSKLLYTGATCIYPKENPQPIQEERFLSGKLEETSLGYSTAKIMGIVACQSYHKQYGLETICAMPTGIYGLNDNYNLETGHMIPSLIKRILMAKKDKKPITLWGSGNPRREALYSEDCADALIYLMRNYNSSDLINIGTGFDYSIKEFAEIIQEELNYNAKITWDETKPDGTFEKRTDIQKFKNIYPSFNPRSFREGLKEILSNDKEVYKIINS